MNNCILQTWNLQPETFNNVKNEPGLSDAAT
jgi:hypothetical protein